MKPLSEDEFDKVIEPVGQVVALFIGIAILICGCVSLYRATYDTYYGLKSVAWPQAQQGQIVRSERLPSSEQTPRGEIEYKFRVNFKTFGNTKVYFGQEHRYLYGADATQYLEFYPVNKPVNVFYDPANPANSVLVPGFENKRFIGPYFFGLVCLLFGSVFMVRTTSSIMRLRRS